MSILQDIKKELAGYLRVESSTTPDQGSTINVGETFTLHIKIKNTAPESLMVVFHEVSCTVAGTEFAVTLDAAGTERDFVEAQLSGNMLNNRSVASVSGDVKLRAKARLSGMLVESVATMDVVGRWSMGTTLELTAKRFFEKANIRAGG